MKTIRLCDVAKLTQIRFSMLSDMQHILHPAHLRDKAGYERIAEGL